MVKPIKISAFPRGFSSMKIHQSMEVSLSLNRSVVFGQETARCENQSLQVRNGPGNPAPDESMGFNGDLMTYNGI